MSSKVRAAAEEGWTIPQSSTTQPPGFLSSTTSMDEEARPRGESLRSTMGALPAPPPPGFNQEHEASGSNRDDNGASTDVDRTSSFSNLAFALGTGLAESMDDAARGEAEARALLTDSFFLDPKNDLSYARHSRHAASRLLGTSPSKDAFGPSHTAPEAGSLFSSSMIIGHKGLPKKTIGGQSSPSLIGPPSSSRQRGNLATSGLTAAFSNETSNDHRNFSYQPKSNMGSTHTSNSNGDHRNHSRLPTTKDLGVTVMEPSDSGSRGGPAPSNHILAGILSSQQNHSRSENGTYELDRGMQNLWSAGGSRNDTAQRLVDPSTDVLNGSDGNRESAEAELRPFMWDSRHHEPSRALAIIRAASLAANDVRAICEKFGVIESFRSDFADSGILFVAYYDSRCAQYAAMELQPQLQRMNGGNGAMVNYCVPLNSSSQNDESLVVLTDVPMEQDIDGLASMLSSFGTVRSLKTLGGNYGGSSFVVEYHDVQDAKQALLELESTQPWGPDVMIEVGTRNPSDRKRGKQILALIGRWRHDGHNSHRRQPDRVNVDVGPYGGAASSRMQERGMGHQSSSSQNRGDPRYDSRPNETTQLVLGPDGRYSYVVVNNQSSYPPSYVGPSPPLQSPHDRVAHGPHGTYVTHVHPSSTNHPPHHSTNQHWNSQASGHQAHNFAPGTTTIVHSSPYQDGQHGNRHYPSGSQSVQYYGDAASTGSHSHHMSIPQARSGASIGGSIGASIGASLGASTTGDGKGGEHLVMDLDAVENGRDSRTSLMVRNIPNKYTQQMLLSEFTENGHGPGIIDFFYLPIDFKNRCNRGYAFINFVDYRDIISFHRRYYSKHWRTFNSDKICDITYARIQGKSAMLKRFENSALMEKDEEYKPLVFASHGPDKGTRLPFPDPSNKP
jgi:hypothetical protein